MAVPKYDLNKVHSSSEANSFKNDSLLYQGSVTLSSPIPAGSILQSITTFTVPEIPVFCKLFGFYQEFMDVTQQYFVGSGFTTAQWYEASVNNNFGIIVTAPAPNAGPLDGLLYAIINGNQISVIALVSNPYSSTISYNPLTIPFGFIEYTMTN